MYVAMFGPQLQQQARAIAEKVVRPIAQIGISPDTISLLGIVFNGIAALVLATGSLRIGGALVLFAGVFDMFDGAVARVQQRTSLFGAFLDSTLDRYAEGAVLLGIAIDAMHQPGWPKKSIVAPVCKTSRSTATITVPPFLSVVIIFRIDSCWATGTKLSPVRFL